MYTQNREKGKKEEKETRKKEIKNPLVLQACSAKSNECLEANQTTTFDN